MNDFTTIQLAIDPRGVATLCLNRPERRNALDARMIAELLLALRQIESDESVRFLILRGNGGHFSAGADLSWMKASAALDYTANLADAHDLGELMWRLFHLACPTLAVVDGAAFGGAVGLTACCDIAIGSRDALFSLSEVRIGLVPAVISPYVVQAIGQRHARRFALSGERFDGACAQAIGLLAECCPKDELDNAVEGWIEVLLQNGPQAMQAAKALFLKVGSGVLTEDLRRHTEQVIAGIRVSKEGQEGLNAFLEKRRPAWQ